MSLIDKETVDALAKEQNLDVTDDVKKLIVAAINSIKPNIGEYSRAIDEHKAQESRRTPNRKTLY